MNTFVDIKAKAFSGQFSLILSTLLKQFFIHLWNFIDDLCKFPLNPMHLKTVQKDYHKLDTFKHKMMVFSGQKFEV